MSWFTVLSTAAVVKVAVDRLKLLTLTPACRSADTLTEKAPVNLGAHRPWRKIKGTNLSIRALLGEENIPFAEVPF